MVGFISASIPTRIERVSNTSLFHVAAKFFGDPTLWTVLAEANGLEDPWITEMVELKIPPNNDLQSNGGILGQ